MMRAMRDDYDMAMCLMQHHRDGLSGSEQAACNQAIAAYTCNERLVTDNELDQVSAAFKKLAT